MSRKNDLASFWLLFYFGLFTHTANYFPTRITGISFESLATLSIACNSVRNFPIPFKYKRFFLRIFKCLFVYGIGIGIHFLSFSSQFTAFSHTNCKVFLYPTVNICSVFWPFHSVGPCLFCFFRNFDYAELYWFSM